MSQNSVDVQGIVSRIAKLNKKEKLHILNILKTHQKDYTKNAYGYFFNLATIEDDALDKVCKCLELIEKNRDLIWEMDKRRDDVLIYYKSLIEEKLKSTIADKHTKYANMLRIHPMNSDLSISFRRVIKIRKRVHYDEDVDPDVLMKEHMKSKKYPKNSVYHRLMTCCKSLRSNRHSRKETDDDGGDVYNDASADAYSEGGVGGSEDVGGDEYEETDIRNDLSDSHSMKDSDSNSLNGEESDTRSEVEQDIRDDDDDDQSIDEQTQTQATETERTQSSKKQEEKLSRLRRLLNMQGFEFDKTSMLRREDYIT